MLCGKSSGSYILSPVLTTELNLLTLGNRLIFGGFIPLFFFFLNKDFFFFKFWVYLCIYLFIYGCIGSSFLCEGFL